MDKKFPGHCHLFVILAREAYKAVIFRRGPTEWVRLITWDTRHDTFEPGQWFKGRIFERRSDLSPSGNELIYFARKISGRAPQESAYKYSWTAISKPPYLTALALWPQGNSWNGGGLFRDSNTVLLNNGYSDSVPHKDHLPPVGLNIIPNAFAPGEDAPIFYERLARDGWITVQQNVRNKTDRRIFDQSHIWRKDNADGHHSLIMELTGWNYGKPGGSYQLTFSIKIKNTPVSIPVDADAWADWDQQGRLVYVKDGKLFAITINGETIKPIQLADFTLQQPEPIDSPDWAKTWTLG